MPTTCLPNWLRGFDSRRPLQCSDQHERRPLPIMEVGADPSRAISRPRRRHPDRRGRCLPAGARASTSAAISCDPAVPLGARVLVDQGRSHRAVGCGRPRSGRGTRALAHTVHELPGGRAGVRGELVAGVPEVVEVEPDREAGFHDRLGPVGRPAEVPAPQHRAALAPEQQPLRTGAGVLLHLGPEFLDEEVRQGDVPDAGDPLARKAKGVPHVTPTRT
jgi:hypothetical protein